MGKYLFHKLSFAGNLFRCPDIEPSKALVKRHTSNLIKFYDIKDSTIKIDTESGSTETSSSENVKAQVPIIRAYSPSDLEDGVKIIRHIIKKETEISDVETASLIYFLLDKQSSSTVSVANLFEMLKEEDPHRTRSFRRDVIRPLREFFPTKPVAKLFTEAMSKEWKAEAGAAKETEVVEEQGSVSKGFNKLINFNNRFPKWLNIFVHLKRKSMGATNHRLDKLRIDKTGGMVKCFLYLMTQGSESEKEFRSLLGNIYQIFRKENEEVFTVFKGGDSEDQQKVFNFLRSIYTGLLVYEILVHDSSILKLEGSSAQSICPDKRVFTIGHMKRAHKEALEGIGLELGDFASTLETTYNAAAFCDFTFNRKDVFVKFMHDINSKKVFFTYSGQVEYIHNLKCSLEESI
ncbi:MAG: hypothetical protein KC646_07540 [Candidatus Cloacimonetes bacterium]|nr:hypothetical protein [Candidatus Cloacimonadota bacterium]